MNLVSPERVDWEVTRACEMSSVLGPWNQGQLSQMFQGLRHIGAARWHVGPSLPRGRAI
ncbi:MAG: hypothetical protein JJU29_19455 [Verrucomicrobia bacterium]|nr:hypothetical protein [Verrucomicrobiota bacterium]MCH8514098.1 hypothetical protein [Kiritimatiellia bacterium]